MALVISSSSTDSPINVSEDGVRGSDVMLCWDDERSNVIFSISWFLGRFKTKGYAKGFFYTTLSASWPSFSLKVVRVCLSVGSQGLLTLTALDYRIAS